MDRLSAFITETIGVNTIIIAILAIVVVYFLYRERARAQRGRRRGRPSADRLLDKLEQSGAVSQPAGTVVPASETAPEDDEGTTDADAGAE